MAQKISGEPVKISKGQNVATAKWPKNIVASACDQLNQESVTERVASAWSGTITQLKQEISENSKTVKNQKASENLNIKTPNRKKTKRIYRKILRWNKGDANDWENTKNQREQHKKIVLSQIKEYFIQERARNAIQQK